jgi:hypothetical protein
MEPTSAIVTTFAKICWLAVKGSCRKIAFTLIDPPAGFNVGARNNVNSRKANPSISNPTMGRRWRGNSSRPMAIRFIPCRSTAERSS